MSRVEGQMAVGALYVVLGTICFAAKSIFIKMAYDKGASPEATLLFRQLLATPLFWMILLLNRSKVPVLQEKRDVVKACFAGLLCFFVSPLLDFLGLYDVSAIVERMLIISYPVFVMILSAFMEKRMISKQNLLAMLVIYVGIYLAIGGWNTNLLEANWIGALLILLSSFVYAAYLILSGQLVHKLGSIRMNAFGMTVASVAMILYVGLKNATGVSINLFQYSLSVYGIFFTIAVVSTVISFMLIVEGIKRMGAERASMISLLGPVITILLGSLFLGERLELWQWIGCIVIFLTITILEVVNSIHE